MANNMIPEKTVERLCAYRRILFRWLVKGKERFYSHELAEEVNITSAQVRRDLMSLNTIGTPKNGYVTSNIIEELGLIIEGEAEQKVVLIGAGNLGNAILSYFVGRRPNLTIIAAFDRDPKKIGCAIAECPCLSMSELRKTVRENKVSLGIITVPGAVAQETANALVDAGVRAIINFAPVKIKVPSDVYLEEMDISIALEKSAYFGRMIERKSDSEGSDSEHKKGSSNNREGLKGGHMKKILCIEDDKDVIESYKAVLQGAGYQVEVAFDGQTGLTMAKGGKPDLIVLDVMMKDDTEGFHVAYDIRNDKDLRYTPILMLTAISSEWGMKFDKNKDGAFLPVDAFVDKPIAPNSLLSAVKRLLSLPKDQINVEGVEK